MNQDSKTEGTTPTAEGEDPAAAQKLVNRYAFVGAGTFFVLNLLTGVVPGGFIGGAIGGGLGAAIGMLINSSRSR